MPTTKQKTKAKSKKTVKKTVKRAVKKTAEVKTTKSVNSKSQTLLLAVLDNKGVKAGTISLPPDYFGQPMNKALIAQAVRVYLANQRQGGAHTKTRGEVKGSGKKIWRQKGTGRARHGDRYSPIFVGGGIAHGPRTRDFSLKISKKMRRRALQVALSEQYRQSNILVLKDASSVKGKTKQMVKLLSQLSVKSKHGKLLEKVMLVFLEKNEPVVRAGKNIEKLIIRPVSLLTTYEVINVKKLIFLQDAVKALR